MYQTTQKEIFHVHTRRCKHAGDYQDEEYIEKAIELGAARIVFTDHGPFPGNSFGNRMDYEQLPEYIESMQKLKELYKDKIEILCGLEIEYLPSYAGYIEELRNMPGIDVMVLGQHFYEHEPGKYSFSDEDKSMEYEGLCDAMIQGLESYCFDVVAHPDRVFRRNKQFGEKEKKAAQKFLDVAIVHSQSTILECNFASTHQKNHYRKEFWEMVSDMPVVFGFDAHSPEEMESGWKYRLQFAERPFTKLSGTEKNPGSSDCFSQEIE